MQRVVTRLDVDDGSTTPWGGICWQQQSVWSRLLREESGYDSRGLAPEDAAAIRGKQYTRADRRRLGFE